MSTVTADKLAKMTDEELYDERRRVQNLAVPINLEISRTAKMTLYRTRTLVAERSVLCQQLKTIQLEFEQRNLSQRDLRGFN